MKSPEKTVFEAILLIATLFALLLLPLAARAACGMQHQPPAFSEVDADGDGSVSEAELTAAHQKKGGEMCGGKCECMGEGKGMQHGKHGGMTMPTFGDLDLDGNGCINAEEFAKHQGEMHK